MNKNPRRSYREIIFRFMCSDYIISRDSSDAEWRGPKSRVWIAYPANNAAKVYPWRGRIALYAILELSLEGTNNRSDDRLRQ